MASVTKLEAVVFKLSVVWLNAYLTTIGQKLATQKANIKMLNKIKYGL